MPNIEGIQKVLIIGSGAIKIGEAVEFGIPIVTNLELPARLAEALIQNPPLGY